MSKHPTESAEIEAEVYLPPFAEAGFLGRGDVEKTYGTTPPTQRRLLAKRTKNVAVQFPIIRQTKIFRLI